MSTSEGLRCKTSTVVMLIIGLACLSGCGVTSKSVYPGTGTTFDLTESGVEVLGQVSCCQGAYCKNDETGRTEWPISLQVPPPAATYQAAIRKKAARTYDVAENQIVIGEIDVSYTSELVGTIRGWTASAIAGRKIERKSP
jgi:hypothetical protein